MQQQRGSINSHAPMQMEFMSVHLSLCMLCFACCFSVLRCTLMNVSILVQQQVAHANRCGIVHVVRMRLLQKLQHKKQRLSCQHLDSYQYTTNSLWQPKADLCGFAHDSARTAHLHNRMCSTQTNVLVHMLTCICATDLQTADRCHQLVPVQPNQCCMRTHHHPSSL